MYIINGMLPNTKPPLVRDVVLGECDSKVSATAVPVEDGVFDFKRDRLTSKVEDIVMEYFNKYPTFANGLFTNDHIQKLCSVVEKYAYKKDVDKKQMVMRLMAGIAKRKLSKDELMLVGNTIEFLHRSKLIEVALYKKVYAFLKTLFR